MAWRRLLLTGCIFIALLGLPRDGAAGIVDVILEMSGPKMYGFTIDCRLTVTGEWDSCKGSGATPLAKAFVAPPEHKVWLSLAGGYYFSADATTNGQHYDRYEVKMVAFDPMLEFESKSWSTKCSKNSITGKRYECGRLRLQFYHGAVGMSYNVLWGRNIETFSNAGLKVRPFGIAVPVGSVRLFGKTWDLAPDFSYDLRLYPQRFTAEDFGKTSTEPEPNGAEVVHSLVFGLRIKKL